MDGWFLLSIAISVGASVTFSFRISREMRSDVKEICGSMNMLLAALEKCQLASLTHSEQGKLVRVVINSGTTHSDDNDSTGIRPGLRAFDEQRGTGATS